MAVARLSECVQHQANFAIGTDQGSALHQAIWIRGIELGLRNQAKQGRARTAHRSPCARPGQREHHMIDRIQIGPLDNVRLAVAGQQVEIVLPETAAVASRAAPDKSACHRASALPEFDARRHRSAPAIPDKAKHGRVPACGRRSRRGSPSHTPTSHAGENVQLRHCPVPHSARD